MSLKEQQISSQVKDIISAHVTNSRGDNHLSNVKSKRYVIDGDPIPLARARIGHGNHMWDSQKQIKLVWGIHLKNQHTGPMFSGPLHIDLVFYVPAPKNKRSKLDGTYCQKRPDLDNLIKFVLDVAQTIIFPEDNCVASVKAVKIYDLQPRTEMTVCCL